MAESNVEQIPLNKIKVSRNSRIHFDPSELEGLMQSIKKSGQLQPIGVIRRGDHFEIAYGNRRFLAVSKLGHATIAAMVHEQVNDFDLDIMNVTENIQRRNISLAEVGRYLMNMKKEGLSSKEAAVRLGVDANYIKNAQTAFTRIPEKYRDDIEVRLRPEDRVNGKQVEPGKISINAANRAINRARMIGMQADRHEELFKILKSTDNLTPEKAIAVVDAMAQGKDPYAVTLDTKRISLTFHTTTDEYERFYKKMIAEGPFKSIRQTVRALLRGEIAEKIDIL